MTLVQSEGIHPRVRVRGADLHVLIGVYGAVAQLSPDLGKEDLDLLDLPLQDAWLTRRSAAGGVSRAPTPRNLVNKYKAHPSKPCCHPSRLYSPMDFRV